MYNIIKSDLYRILKGKAIYIIMIIIIVISLVSAIGLSAGHIGLSVGTNLDLNDVETLEKISNTKSLSEYREVMKSLGDFKLDSQIIGTNVNLYYIFIAIVVILISTDFSNSTVKNTLSSAISKRKYYFSKLILSLAICTFIILFNNYFTYIINYIINGSKFSSSFIEITKITLYQFPLLYGIISFLVSLAFLTRKTALFNGISIPFILVVQMVIMGITNLFKIKADWFYNYEIQFALVKLADNASNEYILKCALLGMAYIIIFNAIGYFLFKKSEIK